MPPNTHTHTTDGRNYATNRPSNRPTDRSPEVFSAARADHQRHQLGQLGIVSDERRLMQPARFLNEEAKRTTCSGAAGAAMWQRFLFFAVVHSIVR